MRDKIFIITNKKAYLFRFFYEKNDIIKMVIKNIMIEKQCEGCPYQEKCCGKSKFRTIRRLIYEEVNEKARERRLSPKGKDLFKKRKTTVERSFGDLKQNHGYRYKLFKDVEKNQAYTHLICVAQNMKNIAIKRANIDKNTYNNSKILLFYKTIQKY